MALGPRFTFFGGKGGVGKTTCAAAAAVRAAVGGARVLIVSTDPAHSLSDVLGLELSAEPRAVRDLGKVQAQDQAQARASLGELFAAELDADKALGRWLREREDAIRTIADRGTYLDEEDIERFLSLSFPGVDELVGLVELLRLSRFKEQGREAASLDVVVVDTAPTGHTLRLLEMPDTIKRLSEVLDDMHAKHRFLASSLGGTWKPDFADEAIESIESEANELRELLGDPKRASFTWVTLPEELSVRESEDGVRGIEELGIQVDPIVVNRVWPTPDQPCALCTPRVAAEQTWRERIVTLFEDKDILEVRARIIEPRGAAALFELSEDVKYLDARKPRAARGRAKKVSSHVIVPGATFVEDAPTMRLQGINSPIAPTVKLVLFGGKGGVGKTTSATASAIELAESRRRERVLLLSTDPAHSIGDVLDVEMTDEPKNIPGGPKNFFVRELDAGRAWEGLRERYRQGIDDLFSAIFSGKMDATFDRRVLEDLLDLAPPGIDELLALVTILDALVTPEPTISEELAEAFPDLADVTDVEGAPTVVVKSLRSKKKTKDEGVKTSGPAFDLVVVDTAPTGHTLRLLALPSSALEWVHALMSVILKYRSVVGLGEFANDLTMLSRRLKTLIALLSDPARSAFVIVTRPAEIPRLETERLARELRALKVPVAAIVANAVTDATCARCTEAAEAEKPELEKLQQLASRAARSNRLLTAPAVYPAPNGLVPLTLWRLTWSEKPTSR